MAKKSKGDKLVVYPKQWPDTRVDKAEIDKDEPVTPHLGHEYRLTKKFSEEAEMEEQLVPGRPPGARETAAKRFKNVRSRHALHPQPIPGGHYAPKRQLERRNEETEVMTDKTFTQFVTEAAKRGRPRKLRPGEEADTLHIQDQLAKLTHPNHVELHFKDGSKHRIPREHANAALHHLNSLKPIHRAEHAEHMAKGHAEFYHVLSKKSIPAKKGKITLAGPKLRKEEVEIDEATLGGKKYKGKPNPHGFKERSVDDKLKSKIKDTHVYNYLKTSDAEDALSSDDDLNSKEVKALNKIAHTGYKRMDVTNAAAKRYGMKKEEADHDDGWYAHKEMHGSNAVSKEDWKKGIRLNKDGKRVQMKKEEVYHVSWGTGLSHQLNASSADEAVKNAKSHLMKKIPKLSDKKYSDTFAKKPAVKNITKEEVEQIDEWGSNKVAKGIRGVRAKLSKMAATLSTVPYKGKQTKPKAQRLTTEGNDYAPLEKGDSLEHGQEATVTSKSKKKGGEKPTPAKDKYLTKEELEIYEALSETGKALFEKMSSDQLAKMVAAYHARGGKIKKGKTRAPRESEKSFPASKMKGSKWAGTARKVTLKNQGYKG